MSSSCLQIPSTSRRAFTFSLVPSLLTVTGDEHILITGEADAQVRLTPFAAASCSPESWWILRTFSVLFLVLEEDTESHHSVGF